ncbi:hypothetical protein HMPREF1248_1019 [Coriobacteriaceae bacterium BV3Ac1]|nr:hypothetical protein HMPREF1248_1019 [Coriobacteriaceae bacterium BV3Ac1]
MGRVRAPRRARGSVRSRLLRAGSGRTCTFVSSWCSPLHRRLYVEAAGISLSASNGERGQPPQSSAGAAQSAARADDVCPRRGGAVDGGGRCHTRPTLPDSPGQVPSCERSDERDTRWATCYDRSIIPQTVHYRTVLNAGESLLMRCIVIFYCGLSG